MLRKLLAYLDYKGRGKDQMDIKSVVPRLPRRGKSANDATRSLAYELFADRIFRTPRMSIRLSAGIEEWVQWERENGYSCPRFHGGPR